MESGSNPDPKHWLLGDVKIFRLSSFCTIQVTDKIYHKSIPRNNSTSLQDLSSKDTLSKVDIIATIGYPLYLLYLSLIYEFLRREDSKGGRE
jgi:cytochrome bd-type quinol oxidase subunit 2